MKTTKKLTIITMALMLAFVFAFSNVFAYTPVGVTGTPATNTADQLKHTLKIIGDETEIPDGVTATYSFVADHENVKVTNGTVTTGEGENKVTSEIVISKSYAGSKAPTIANVVYDSQTQFSNKVATKNMVVDWTGVEFSHPGTYTWPITQSVNYSGTQVPFTNDNANTMKLVAHVINFVDTNNVETLAVSAWYLFTGDNKTGPGESWGSTTPSLSIEKQVTGNKGSKEEYFKFTVDIKVPAAETASAGKTYDFGGSIERGQHEDPVNGNSFVNASSVSLAQGETEAQIEVYLKHGQTLTIVDLPKNTTYSIKETNDKNYKVTTSIAENGDTVDGQEGASTTPISLVTNSGDTSVEVKDAALQKDTTVKYTNNKEEQTPTGIILQFGAPIAGVIIVGILFGVVFMRRRSEEDYEYDE